MANDEYDAHELKKKFLDLVRQANPNHEENVKESIAKQMIFVMGLHKQLEENDVD